MKFKENTLRLYAAPLSDTENEKCKRTIEAIRDALKDLGYTDDQNGIKLLESDTLSYSINMRNKSSLENITIFIQGSYANNTCVRNESDVDIAIIREDVYEYASGERFCESTTNQKDVATNLKNAVERILRIHFPCQVTRGNKSIKVKGNTYRKNADTVPGISLHYFYKTYLNDYSTFLDGMVIYADDGQIIQNFPKQHIFNGKAKNNKTQYYYKRMVRIIKKMRCLMSELGYSCADDVSSFGLESLLWNLPDSCFTKWTCYGFAFEEIVNYLYKNKHYLSVYKEANGIKQLCPTQRDVDAYGLFIDQLYRFFEYDYSS